MVSDFSRRFGAGTMMDSAAIDHDIGARGRTMEADSHGVALRPGGGQDRPRFCRMGDQTCKESGGCAK